MRVLIRRENGTRAEALILAASKHRMRVAVAGGNETEDFRRCTACGATRAARQSSWRR